MGIPEEYQISDEQINAVWGNANFGNSDRREVILTALLQVAGRFCTGHTAMCICQELGLMGHSRKRGGARLTKKGSRVMYYWNEADKKIQTQKKESV